MSAPAPLAIAAVVDAAERPAFTAAAEQLGECLDAAGAGTWPVRLSFRPALPAMAPAPAPAAGPAIIIVSLFPELALRNEPMAARAARWRAQLVPLVAAANVAVFLCTVFRAVADRRSGDTLERIRRLNLLAAELSQETGVGIIDIDRFLAHIGARYLRTDYRLTSAVSHEIAGHAIVASLLAIGLDDAVPSEVLEAAKRFHGGLYGTDPMLRRRFARRQHARQGHGPA